MAVIAFIEAEDVIEKILKHLGLWELTPRPVCVHRTGRPPRRMAKSQPLSTEPHIDYSDSQVPALARLWRVYPPLEGLSASGGLIQKIGACPGLDPGR